MGDPKPQIVRALTGRRRSPAHRAIHGLCGRSAAKQSICGRTQISRSFVDNVPKFAIDAEIVESAECSYGEDGAIRADLTAMPIGIGGESEPRLNPYSTCYQGREISVLLG